MQKVTNGCVSRKGDELSYWQAWQCQFWFNSNSIPNMSPALQVLFLIVLVTQLFKTMICSPKCKYKTQKQELDFKISAM